MTRILVSSLCCGLVLLFNCNIYLTEHLDFMNSVDSKDLDITPFTQVVHEYSGYQSLTDVPKAIVYNEPEQYYGVSKNYLWILK